MPTEFSPQVEAGQHKISVWMRLQVILVNGGVGERLKPAVLKTVRVERVSGVRIPPPPPVFYAEFLRCTQDFAGEEDIIVARGPNRPLKDAGSARNPLDQNKQWREG